MLRGRSARWGGRRARTGGEDEGQYTRPRELEQALRRDFSNDAALAARQRLALAHIERTAVTLLTALLKRGLLKSDTPQGKVRFGLPLHALRFYFPAQWPEAEADAAAG